MYEAVTRGIRIRVTPQYLEEQSTPEDSEFFWAYTIDIANESDESVQLRSRVWRITDGMLRLSVGLEAFEDLAADLETGLAAVRRGG